MCSPTGGYILAYSITRLRGVIGSVRTRHQAQGITNYHLTYAGTMADVPLLVVSDNSSAERRITPAWSISTLKTKLETVTGIPPSAQRILLKTASEGSVPIEAGDEDSTYLTAFHLTAYAELHVSICPLSLSGRSVFLPCSLFCRGWSVDFDMSRECQRFEKKGGSAHVVNP